MKATIGFPLFFSLLFYRVCLSHIIPRVFSSLSLLFSFVHIDEAIWRSFTHTLKIQSKSSPSSIFYCRRRRQRPYVTRNVVARKQVQPERMTDKETERIHIDTPFFFTSHHYPFVSSIQGCFENSSPLVR